MHQVFSVGRVLCPWYTYLGYPGISEGRVSLGMAGVGELGVMHRVIAVCSCARLAVYVCVGLGCCWPIRV